MRKVFAIRHQAAGVFHEALFLDAPTEEQTKEVLRVLAYRHGTAHPKSGETYWWKVEEIPVHEPRDALRLATAEDLMNAARARDALAAASPDAGVSPVARFGAHGVGTVKNPGE